MAQEDVDMWYDEKKEKLTSEYHKRLLKLQKDKDKKFIEMRKKDENSINQIDPLKPPQATQDEKALISQFNEKRDKLKKDYEKVMKKLHEDYLKRSEGGLSRWLKRHFFKHKIDKKKKWLAKKLDFILFRFEHRKWKKKDKE